VIERDGHGALPYPGMIYLGMIFSENRCTLFRIIP